MASQLQLLIALLVLAGIVLTAAVALQGGATIAPLFTGTRGTYTGAEPAVPTAGTEPTTVVNVFENPA